MTDQIIIILSCVFASFIITIGLAAAALIIAVRAVIEVEAFKRSTHQVQYVPADQVADLDEQMAKAETNFFDAGTLKDKSDDGEAL